MPDTPQYLDAQGNPLTSRQAATMVAPPSLDAQGNPLGPDPGVEQAGADIEQNIAKYRRLGVPTDELGRPTRALTFSEWFANAIANPSPAARLSGDLAAMATGFLGPKTTQGLPSRAASTADAPSVPGMVAKGIIKKISGVDADELAMKQSRLELQATRMRLQAARSRTRQESMRADTDAPPRTAPAPAEVPRNVKAPKADKLADAPITPDMEAMANRMAGGADMPSKGNGTMSATSPAETSSAPAPQARRSARAAKSSAPPPNPSDPLSGLKSVGLSDAEAEQAFRWAKAGIADDQIVKRIVATRALMGAKPELNNLPTLQQALNEVRSR